MDEVRVGIVETDDAEAVADAVEAAGGTPVRDRAAALAEAGPDAVVAHGEAALRALADADPGAPTLPVDADPGVHSVPPGALEAAVESLVAGAFERRSLERVTVTADDETVGHALREVALVTAGPAMISEFALSSASLGQVATVRADGLVVATPSGSHGYASAGEGPLLAPGTGLAAVPVAPFVTDPDRWVLPAERVDLEVRRDEAPVAVEVDGVECALLGADDAVALEPGPALTVAVTAESDPPLS